MKRKLRNVFCIFLHHFHFILIRVILILPKFMGGLIYKIEGGNFFFAFSSEISLTYFPVQWQSGDFYRIPECFIQHFYIVPICYSVAFFIKHKNLFQLHYASDYLKKKVLRLNLFKVSGFCTRKPINFSLYFCTNGKL